MIANPLLSPKLYTYQDLAALFGVHAKTVSRWFRGRRIFRPNHSTVRVTQDQLDKFMKESDRKPKTKKP